MTCVSNLRTNSKIQLILQVSRLKWKFREDDSTQIHPPDISADEKVHVQLMIAWDRKIAMHHRPDTTTTDGEIQDNVGPQDHGALTVDTTTLNITNMKKRCTINQQVSSSVFERCLGKGRQNPSTSEHLRVRHFNEAPPEHTPRPNQVDFKHGIDWLSKLVESNQLMLPTRTPHC
ncbi:hypothetical protein BHE74_00033972 [Ensete ventricosum]|nr:hypothetical protein GW17_00039934 [Ensete ventricosum]RWW59096.1 hypothetical protein BHE74_00033972 [Ensete ventricosum]